jgi:nitrogen fixation/metabolism regulation signal transduction histidine kinase
MNLNHPILQSFKTKKLTLFTAFVLLLFALVLRLFFIGGFRSEAQYRKAISSNLEQTLDNIKLESNKIKRNTESVEILDFSGLHTPTEYAYYLFEDSTLVYWSDYQRVPSYQEIQGKYDIEYRQLAGGSYVISRDTLTHSSSQRDLELFITLPIYRENKINNKYISSGYNTEIFPQGALSVFPPSSDHQEAQAIYYDEKPIFKVLLEQPARGYREHQTAKSFQTLLIVLIVLSMSLILLNIFRGVHSLLAQQHFDQALLLVICSLCLLRLLMLYFDFPFGIMPLRLFDGRYYAASALNPSLGDLLLNAVSLLMIFIYLFIFYRKSHLYQSLFSLKPRSKSIVSLILLFAGVGGLFLHYTTIKSIYFNSQWTLDITENLSFSTLKVISLLVFVINTVTYFLFAHIIYRTFISLSYQADIKMRWILVAALVISLATYFVWEIPTLAVILISFAYLGILYSFQLPRFLNRISYVSFLYLFICALISAITGALASYDIQQVNSLDNKQKFANTLLVDNDVLGEYLLNEIVGKIQEDKFIKNRLFSTFASKDVIRNKINRVYLSNYFDRYDIEIYLFNSKGQPLEDNELPDYQQFEEITQDERFTTEHPGIFFINEVSDQRFAKGSPKRYLTLIELEDYNTTIGYVIIDLSLKRFIPNRVYPELLIDRTFLQSYPSDDYDYAIFNAEGEMTYSTGDEVAFRNLAGYSFGKNIENEKILSRDAYDYLIVKGKADEFIVIASATYSLFNVVSNFSFLFLLLVLAILILLAIYSIYFAFKEENLNFSTKIQLYLNAAFFMPLLAVSITTLSVISRSYSEEVDEAYLNKAEQISTNVKDMLENYQQGQMSIESLTSSLSQLSKYAETDANIFDQEGQLITTSQPLVYEDSLLAGYINPMALANIKEQNNNKLVLEESVGSLSYKSSYIGLKSANTGELMGILSLPFFESRSQLEEQIIQVVTNIMNIFTFVFIAFLIISYLASVLLTYPLKYITQKIRRTSLADYNEPLSWDSDDEIGLMIGEYNKMLVKLEASKEALARSEKESAWREMARQVAHEIKNPLTPMKLSLQHLKRKLKVDYRSGMNAEEVSAMSSPFDNLIHQIDTLSDIASSFSDFAKMPTPKSEYFDFAVLLKKVVGLFEEDGGYIHMQIGQGDFHIISDEQLMGRIITNLIINARQSIPKNRIPKVEISLQIVGRDKLILKISDNGTGIAKEIQDKVFLPNFSTKYAGSGIGLAISKRGIEHAGGRIAFDTQEGKGTTFLIELPLAFKSKMEMQSV